MIHARTVSRFVCDRMDIAMSGMNTPQSPPLSPAEQSSDPCVLSILCMRKLFVSSPGVTRGIDGSSADATINPATIDAIVCAFGVPDDGPR